MNWKVSFTICLACALISIISDANKIAADRPLSLFDIIASAIVWFFAGGTGYMWLFSKDDDIE